MNRELLEKEFPEELIKNRPGGYGKLLEYIEIANVIQRLNEAFDAAWSFEVVDRLIEENEVIVLGKLTAEGISKMQWGGSQIVKSNKSGEPVSLADDLKAAASDSIKKCASHFGVALSIYGRELPPDEPITSRTNGTITQEQLQHIKEIRTEMANKGRRFLGVRAIRAQSPFSSPKTREPRGRINPRIACRDKWKRIERIRQRQAFLSQYRHALALWREGNTDVVFPAGTYWMRHHANVRCADDPCTFDSVSPRPPPPLEPTA